MNKYNGKIISADSNGIVTIKARINNIDKFIGNGNRFVSIELIDNRKISPKQRNMIWGLIGDISEWIGESKGETNQNMKQEFLVSIGENPEELFSLSDISVSTAREYQKFLIDFILENGISTKYNLIDNVDDVVAYVYSCLIHKKCCVCGNPCELHHVDRVGMGRDRNEITHIGMRALPLCREHHTEAHTMTNQDFLDKYHLTKAIRIDERIGSVYGLG